MIPDLQLDNLKPGDQVVAVAFKNGQFVPSGAVCTLLEFRSGRWYYSFPSKPTQVAGTFPPDGGCHHFMSKRATPDYYFSANPEHIAANLVRREKARIEREQREAALKVKMDEFQQKLKDLMAEYGAGVYAVQTNGDDQGVEMEVHFSIGNLAFVAEK
jgi:hypothetical protein